MWFTSIRIMQISVVSRKFHVAIPKVKTSILFVIKATSTSNDDSTSPLRAKFHVPVMFHFKWVRNGHIGQKMGDVTRFMEGYFYVGCRLILISYFLTKFGE